MSDNEVREVTLIQHFKPLLHTVRYYVLHNKYLGTQILDAKRVAWNNLVHSIYAPNVAYRDPFDENFYLEKSANSTFRDWMNFDIEFHLQPLVPVANVSSFQEYVKTNAFDSLVFTFGNVVPEALARFLPDGLNDPLVQDAIVLQYLTTCMKDCAKVWMNQSDLTMLTYSTPKIVEACQRLVQRDAVRMENDHVALSWAAILLVEAVERGVRVTFLNGAKPTHIKDLKSEYVVDPRLPIDFFIERKKLPSTVLCPKVPMDAPSFAPLRHFNKKMEMTEFMRERYAEHIDKPLIVISETGCDMIPSQYGSASTTIKMTRAFPPLCVNEVARVTQKWNDTSVFIAVKTDGTKVHLDDETYFNAAVPFNRISFDRIREIPAKLSGVVLMAMFSGNVPTRWAHALRQFEENNVLLMLRY